MVQVDHQKIMAVQGSALLRHVGLLEGDPFDLVEIFVQNDPLARGIPLQTVVVIGPRLVVIAVIDGPVDVVLFKVPLAGGGTLAGLVLVLGPDDRALPVQQDEISVPHKGQIKLPGQVGLATDGKVDEPIGHDSSRLACVLVRGGRVALCLPAGA